MNRILSGDGSVEISRMATKASRARLIFATALGNGLEIFDFTVYSFFAATIGNQFFPATSELTSLLLSVGTFGVGFFMRPLGAIVLGGYADRVGRRAAMMLTIWLMALGTAIIGLCPSYGSIGIAAPLIVLLARLVQGFAAGGEVGAATTFLLESGPLSKRGYFVSWQAASQGAASLLGASLGLFLSRTLSPADLSAWGWRVPFLLGLLIAPVGYYIRRQLDESSIPDETTSRSTTPFVTLFREHSLTIVLATFFLLGGTVSVYVTVYFMPSYISRVMHLSPYIGFLCAALSSLVMLVVSPFAGKLADRLQRRKPLVLFSTGASTCMTYPVFLLITRAHGTVQILCGTALVTGLMCIGGAAGLLLILEGFPAKVRASGFSIAYAIAATLFGGTAQFVVTWLIRTTGNPMAAGGYVTACGVIAFIALLCIKEREVADRP